MLKILIYIDNNRDKKWEFIKTESKDWKEKAIL